MPHLNYLPSPLPENATLAQAVRWLRQLVRYVGPGFHPDTSFHDYVRSDGSTSFTREDASILEADLIRPWRIFDRARIEIYAIALPAQRDSLTRSMAR